MAGSLGPLIHLRLLEYADRTGSGRWLQVQDILIDTDPERDPRYDMISVEGRGSFERHAATHLSAQAPTSTQLANWNLESVAYYVVAAEVCADSLNTRYLVGIEVRLTFPDTSESIVFTPSSVETSMANAVAQQGWVAQVLTSTVPPFVAEGELAPGQLAPPGHAPPPPGSVWCYCPECYLQCLEQSECDDTYAYCVGEVCDPVHQACMDGADQVYIWCIGNCPCSGSPGIWCTARCYGCAINLGFQQGLCWSARIGCLSGCELANPACYSGCYRGSWTTYVDPPGCP